MNRKKLACIAVFEHVAYMTEVVNILDCQPLAPLHTGLSPQLGQMLEAHFILRP